MEVKGRFRDFTDLGIILNTPENRKQPNKTRNFPCYRCGEKSFKIKKTAYIYGENFSNSIISGSMPPTGFLKRSEGFVLKLCPNCQDEENKEYDI